ncbi:MAG TPA: amino acid adenylation domain-containing protein [Herpetosiphonaceae bacterium]
MTPFTDNVGQDASQEDQSNEHDPASRPSAGLFSDRSHQLLSADERQTLLATWNVTERDIPQDCIHELFRRQAARMPDAVALVDGAARLTYAELNQRANQLAHQLQSLGVGPDVLVGLCLDRSLTLVVALLAILKAGGAYVPLDPAYPADRLSFMLQDTATGVILTEQRLAALLPPNNAQILYLDTDDAVSYPITDPPHHASADNLACVIYTSGSTGRPKGTCITHRGIARLVCNTDYIQLTPDDRVAQASNTAFDAATFEIWGTLLTGARIVIIDREMALAPHLFAAVLQEQQITTAFMTTAWFNQVSSAMPEAFGSLRYLLFGGEACDPERVRAVLHHGAPAHLLHMYGPTESTTFASWYEITDVPADATTVPIGRPIANTQLYVLDTQMQPVPIGVPGELYVGGLGLARDYLHRPELTAERFVPHPFSHTPGARLYKTGDQVRYRPDGAIEFLGRIDQQVKLRGFRIELGEIQAVLRQHEAVRDAVVVVRDDRPGDRRLVAYIVGEQANQPTNQPTNQAPSATLGEDAVPGLRAFLQQRLPEYMVPSAFVVLDALPLTPNGKLDRKALPVPQRDDTGQREAFVAPRTDQEAVIAEIWESVLGIAPIGVEDDFFALGGHSLLATQMVTRLRHALGHSISLRLLFEAPTIAALVAHLAEPPAEAEIPLVAAPRDGSPLPLSFAQQRLWFLDQWERESPLYNVVVAYRLVGPLDCAILTSSLNAIVRRHAALRASFPIVDREPVQLVAPDLTISVPLIDLRHLPEAERLSEAQRLLSAEAQRPFTLDQLPLLRALITRLSDDDQYFLLMMHHIITDGWSMTIVMRELAALYHAAVEKREAPLVEPPLQYTDFAIWQRQWLSAEGTRSAFEQQLAYWQRQLANAPTILELPTDYPRPPAQTFRGGRQVFALPQPLTAELHALSQREHTTIFMLLLAAWATLLARYANQEEVLIGVPIANRTRAAIEDVVGFFVNTLPLRIDLTDQPGFQQLLQRVREVSLDAYAHQDIPFERLVEAAQPARNLSYAPLFQVMFAFQNTDFTAFELPGLAVTPVAIETQTAMFDLTLEVIDAADGLRASLEYNTDLFEPATITRLIGHLRQLLTAIVADPQQSVAQLPLLPEYEQSQILAHWNATALAYPQDRCIHTLFEEQAARTPAAIAVVAPTGQLSYRELNERANQVAHYLKARGVGPEVLVGVSIERSLELIISLLGVLKAGGAYVPIDPRYPQQRIAAMLQDTQLSMLITTERLKQQFAGYDGDRLYLDADGSAIEQQSRSNLEVAAQATNLMYIIYTSGSTGVPKGVMMSHRAVCNHFAWMQARFPIDHNDAVLQQTSLSFDVSVWELFAPLAQGARLVIAGPGDEKDPPALAATIAAHHVTIIQIVPLLLRILLEEAAFTQYAGLRRVFCGGEAMPPDLPEQFYAHATAELVNMYGPTETCIDATYWVCERGAARARIPIGRPIGNAQAYILDQYRQIVPIGVAGELYIGGAGLARGYFNRPELTRERFVPHPFSADVAARLYKTGDRARSLPDGTIEFLGRIDRQVKLRGFRIELGEIEAALLSHPAIREVAVLDHDHPTGQQLVAYVVCAAGQHLTSPELREYARQFLPEYMVPVACVILPALPMTANGKIDRAALPAPDLGEIAAGASYVAPQTPTEALLADIWTTILRRERVGIHDNFFDLGGNSLIATRCVAHVRDALQIDLQVRILFEAPTIAALGRIIDARESTQPSTPQALVETIDEAAAQQLLAGFSGLSDDEVNALLASMMLAEEVPCDE